MSWTLLPDAEENQDANDSVPQNDQPQTNEWTLIPQEKEQPESWGQYGRRLAAQGGSAVFETVAGLPEDLGNAFKEGVGNLALDLYEKSSIGLKENDPIVSTFDKDAGMFENFYNFLKAPANEEKVREVPEYIRDFLTKPSLPEGVEPWGSKEIRKKMSDATDKYTEPKSKGEEVYRNAVQDLTNLILTRRIGPRMSLPRTLAAGILPEIFGEGVKQITGKEADKQKAKIGSMFFLTMFNPGGAQEHVSNMYNEVRNMVPEGSRANVTQSIPRLRNFQQRTMRSGISTESTNAVMRDANALENMLVNANGNPEIHAILDLKQRINENRSRFYATSATSMERRTARRLYGDLMREVDQLTETALNQVPNIQANHPLDLFREANQGWTTLHQAEDASRFMSRIIPKKMRGGAMAALLESGFRHPSLAIKGLGAGMAGIGILSGARVVTQVMNSPTLRRYYLNSVRSAMQGNSKAALSNFMKLNEEWEKENKSQKSK